MGVKATEVLGSLQIVLGVGLFIACQASPAWLVSLSNGSYQSFGLYQNCIGSTCTAISWNPVPFQYASSLVTWSLFILPNLLILISLFCYVASFCATNRPSLIISAGVLLLIAGIFELLGTIIFTAWNTVALVSSSVYLFGYSLFMAWMAGPNLFLAGILFILAGKAIRHDSKVYPDSRASSSVWSTSDA